MPTNERPPWLRKRQPRIDPSSRRVETNQSELYTQLRTELETLRQRLAETEAKLATLEKAYDRRERLIRACSMCGRVSTRPGPNADCPYCKTGRLHQV
ncbi:hypothetical protein [Haladaptatus caseinilyticus]|uniref:hypothetical protein n=1 Tax=Haladaptatus caseinilyticus TaxID=2993314 RepID=UPI00224AAEA4|nr:hypothetical protein [Haladaptatus caseinilyticus]